MRRTDRSGAVNRCQLMQHTGTAALLERDAELEQLGALLADASEGRGRLVLVEGAPGIGKTRLLDAARAQARALAVTTLSARASELDRDFPFAVARQLFESLIAARPALLRGAAARAAGLLGAAPAGEPAPESDPSWAHFHALYWLVANLAEDDGAVALAIDDAHWADASSLRFLQFLAPRLGELPVLLVLAARPSEPGIDHRALDALATDPLTAVLRPPPLSEAAVAAMIGCALGDASEPPFSDACRQATGGNPFLLRELLRELASDGLAPTAERAGLVRQLAPPTVARAVLLRLARLGEEAPALARAVAVLGDGTTLHRTATLAGLDPSRADEAAAALADAAILADARPLAFAHPVLRSAVYADVGPGERSRAHGRAAALLAGEGAGADAQAVHLLAPEPAGDRATAATLREAAVQALGRGAAATAVGCLRRALAEPPPAAERGAFLLELATAEVSAGDGAAAAADFEDAMRLTPDPRRRARYALQQAMALQMTGRHDEAFTLRERRGEEVAAVDAEAALALEASLIATARLDLTRLEWARERLERHRGRTGTSLPERRLVSTQAHLDAYSRGRDDPASAIADAAERALAGGTLADAARGLEATPFYSAVELLLLADRIEPARAAVERHLDHGRRLGYAAKLAFGWAFRALLLARQGALGDAEADARRCADLALAQGWFVMGPMILGYILDVLIDRGELDDAEALLAASGMADRPAGADLTFHAVAHARARLRAARGDLDAARAALAALARRDARWNTHPSLVPGILVAPGLAGDDFDAERMLRDARTWGTPRALGMALHAAGLAAGDTDLLAEAATELERSPARLEHARALTDLGAALRRANRRSAAREPLRRALDLAQAGGAAPPAARAHHELRAAGARPPRAPAGGRGARARRARCAPPAGARAARGWSASTRSRRASGGSRRWRPTGSRTPRSRRRST